MEYLSDRLTEPEDLYMVFTWDRLSRKSQNTLQRAIERSDAWKTSKLDGFTFDLLSKVSLEDLNDARSIGPARAEELIQELTILFDNLNSRRNLDSAENATSQIISVSSFQILSKLTVDEDLDKYLTRIGSFDSLTPQQRHTLLQELLPSKNPFTRMMFGKRDKETALGHLIDANLRLSFALAKRVCADRDLRARAVAGNLGLLAGITSFSDKPNIDFEGHVMRYVREFIHDLIGSFNLSYDDIIELMLDANDGNNEPTEYVEEVGIEGPFESCKSFSELFAELDIELLKLQKVDDRALAMLKNRHYAFGEPGLTLDQIGKKWNLTRERVRQIVEPLMNVRIEVDSEVPILLEAVEIFEDCENEQEFQYATLLNEIFAGERITWERLWGVALILSPDELAKRIYEKHQEFIAVSSANSHLRGPIRKDRSKFGLYDLQVVSKKYGIDEDEAFRIISEIYPRSNRTGHLVLAGTKNLDTMFHNSIAKQLKVASPLDVRELLKGLQRSGKQRDTSLTGSVTDLTNLIQSLAGNPPNYNEVSMGLMKEIEFHTIESWLIEIFSGANLGILHSNDVVNFALREKHINISSATVYLLNSPIIRSHGRSLYSLVGTDVTENQLDDYIQVIRGSSEASEVSYEMMDASKGILSVKPNLNVITSGIVFPPSGYKQIFEGFQFETSCACGQLETIQSVKFTPSGFWTGFTAMIRHGFSYHQMNKRSTFQFEFDFDRSVVRLLVN